MVFRTFKLFGPLTRTIASPDGKGAVASAAIVVPEVFTMQG